MKISIWDDDGRLVFETPSGLAHPPSGSPQDTASNLESRAVSDVATLISERVAGPDKDLLGKDTDNPACTRASISPDLATQPDLAATIFNTLGRAYLNSGYLDIGRRFVEQAAQIRRDVFGEEHPAMAESLQALARLDRDDHELVRAESRIRRALGIQIASGSADSLTIVPALWELAVIQHANGQVTAAEQSAREGLRIIEQLHLDHCDLYVPRLWESIALAHYARGEYREAADLYSRMIDRALKTLGKDSHEYAFYLHGFGTVERARGNLPAAEAHYREAIRIFESINARHPNLSVMYVDIGRLLMQRGERYFEETRAFYRKAMEITASTRGRDHVFFAYDQSNLGRLELESGNLDAAHELLQDSLRMFRRQPKWQAHVAATLISLAKLHIESHIRESAGAGEDSSKLLQHAEAFAAEALAICRTESGEGTLEYAVAGAALWMARFLRGNATAEIEEHLTECHAVIVEKQGAHSRNAKQVSKWISNLETVKNRFSLES